MKHFIPITIFGTINVNITYLILALLIVINSLISSNCEIIIKTWLFAFNYIVIAVV